MIGSHRNDGDDMTGEFIWELAHKEIHTLIASGGDNHPYHAKSFLSHLIKEHVFLVFCHLDGCFAEGVFLSSTTTRNLKPDTLKPTKVHASSSR